jgi:hypothetical protein
LAWRWPAWARGAGGSESSDTVYSAVIAAERPPDALFLKEWKCSEQYAH